MFHTEKIVTMMPPIKYVLLSRMFNIFLRPVFAKDSVSLAVDLHNGTLIKSLGLSNLCNRVFQLCFFYFIVEAKGGSHKGK